MDWAGYQEDRRSGFFFNAFGTLEKSKAEKPFRVTSLLKLLLAFCETKLASLKTQAL